ncbi:MAG: hypothetical protein H6742_06350 [Alphaproteobacteria bacterium]|nr:hypothetical protein [Alphaproteobacteria bacterium]
MTRTAARLLGIATLGLLALATGEPAHAEGFQVKTMRDPLPSREYERGLVIGKGWAEWGVGADVKLANGYWDGDGNAQDFENAKFLHTTERVGVRYGISRRAEVFMTLPFHYQKLTNDALGTDISQFGIGDPKFGWKVEAFRSMAPVTSLIAYTWYKAPAGNESPGSYIGGPDTFSSFVVSTGTPDLALGVAGKRQVGPLAFELDLSYVRRFSGATMWAVETTNNQFAGRIKPGDITRAKADVMLQIWALALHGGADFQLRQAMRVGTTADGWFPGRNLEAIEGSDGWYLDVPVGVIANISRGVDLDLAATVPVRGEDLMFFPIEDIHPTRGLTLSGTLELRY